MAQYDRIPSPDRELWPFEPMLLYGVEDIYDYGPGGFHPICIGDRFSHGRYRVVHKLGYGGSSTVWIARDNDQGRLVALQALRADVSSAEVPALVMSNTLRARVPPDAGLQFIDDHFLVQGPNGTHTILISPLAGPNLRATSNSPNRTEGSRRLRADLARKVARQTAMALYHVHSAGVVHGDLTTANIMFSLAPHVIEWSDEELYERLGKPKTDTVKTRDGNPRPSCIPTEMVDPINNDKFVGASPQILQESIVVGDFGQSYAASRPPPNYEPATSVHYFSPEARFEKRAGLEADIWSLGCTIFAIRAGYELFDSFYRFAEEVLVHTVQTLGKLPEPWWSAFERRDTWFGEDGEPKSEEEQESLKNGFSAEKRSIREKLRLIGRDGEPPLTDEGPMIELYDAVLGEEEVELLGDLLERMLKYKPEERMKIDEVIAHPWFAMNV